MSRIDTFAHARILADDCADARHQQRVGAQIVEEVVLGRNAVDAQHSRSAECRMRSFSVFGAT